MNPAPCPLRSESDRNGALPRNEAIGHKPTYAPQQKDALFYHFVGAGRKGAHNLNNEKVITRFRALLRVPWMRLKNDD
jgi:hypothetical protein